mgnify:CR=1 FL=1
MKTIFILLTFLLLPIFVFADGKLSPVVVHGDKMRALPQENKVVAVGNVKVVYNKVKLLCDKVVYNSKTNIALITGKVKVIKQNTTLLGDKIVYDFNTGTIKSADVRMESPPVYGHAVKKLLNFTKKIKKKNKKKADILLLVT